MTTNPAPFSKRIAESLAQRQDAKQWELVIGSMLHRLELDAADLQEATREYQKLGDALAAKLSVPRVDVDIFPQGSMRTQTTISPRHPLNFDLDIVVKLSGPRFVSPNPEIMFREFGQALEGNEAVTGKPEQRRRCWKLPYPGRSFYFDVTPTIDDPAGHLRVRDAKKGWAPSNPKEFADWFCTIADFRFPFQEVLRKAHLEARSEVTPLPANTVGLDDILRRSVQLMKLHRTNMYWFEEQWRKDAAPISVVIVTLATLAYSELHRSKPHEFKTPIEVVLALVEAMPRFIERRNGVFWVANPRHPAENFAERWGDAGSKCAPEFFRWHKQLEDDLEVLLTEEHSSIKEDKIRSVFGAAGVDAWKAGQPKPDVLSGLLASTGPYIHTKPKEPLQSGSSTTLG